jgi:hypothetical protein
MAKLETVPSGWGSPETRPLQRKAAHLIKTFLSFAYSSRVVIPVELTLP